MTTPIADFIARYVRSDAARLHMPGHKGRGLPEAAFDITEIEGADALYEADGVIAESEVNAAAIFGTGRTAYSTEGSSQCIRAMLYLAATYRGEGMGRFALAGRNAHKTFVHAAALCGFDAMWLYPEGEQTSPCACPISPERLDGVLGSLKEKPFCVYVTSPDYLGNVLDIAGLSRVCRERGVPLLVDNAHGAYLRFMENDLHPISLGADMCCDSAHKTLSALTGAAYLHISKSAPAAWRAHAKEAMALFGSTSPSYLTLRSLDLCNASLSGDYPARLRACTDRLDDLKSDLMKRGFRLAGDERLKLSLRCDGRATAARLRQAGVECEFADGDHLVMMFSPENSERDFERVSAALGEPDCHESEPWTPPVLPAVMSLREAVFRRAVTLPVQKAVGRICAAPTVACPPAIPIAVSGEVITPEAVEALLRFDVNEVSVVEDE